MAGRRRNAAEWAILIRELEASGKPLPAFARARGIRPDTLKWWCWRLRTKPQAAKSKSKAARSNRDARVKLISVAPVRDCPQGEGAEVTPVWELVAPTGHALRVYDRAGRRVLKAALSSVTGNRRR